MLWLGFKSVGIVFQLVLSIEYPYKVLMFTDDFTVVVVPKTIHYTELRKVAHDHRTDPSMDNVKPRTY